MKTVMKNWDLKMKIMNICLKNNIKLENKKKLKEKNIKKKRRRNARKN